MNNQIHGKSWNWSPCMSKKNLNDATFMTTPLDGKDENSEFYKTLTNITDLSPQRTFLIACCAATVTCPVEDALKYTHWNRVVLPVASRILDHVIPTWGYYANP